MSSQSTNTARHFFREFQTQTSVESLAKIQEEAIEEPEKPVTPEIPKKIWGPIDFPVAEISKITHSSCEVRHRVLNLKYFETTHETRILWCRIKTVDNPIKVAVSRKCHLLYNLMHSNVQRIKFATNFKTRRFCYNRMYNTYYEFHNKKIYHFDLKKQVDLRKCSILIAVTLLWHVALLSLVRHHTSLSLLS